MFLKVPPLRIGDKENQWFLEDALIYRMPDDSLQILIPAGFETDLASVPRIFRRIVNVNGKSRLAAIPHDYLYSVKGDLSTELEKKTPLSRKQCDEIFLEAMKELGVGFLTRQAMYYAVRAGGWIYWNF